MELRITQGRLFSSAKRSISEGFKSLTEIQDAISDGREVRKPSDDPVRSSRAMSLRLQIQRTRQYLANIDRGSDLLESSTSSLQELNDRLSSVRATATAAASSVQPPENRAAFATEVNQALERFFSLANTQFDDVPLFGGTATRETPYVAERDADGQITAVTFRGNHSVAPMQVGPDERLIATVSGAEAFADPEGQFPDLFGALIELRDEIADVDGLPAEDLGDRIREILPAVDRIEDRLLISLGKLGSRLSEVDGLRDHLLGFELFAESALSETEDLDTVEAVLDLQQRQTALQAAASVASQILNTNLLNFLL